VSVTLEAAAVVHDPNSERGRTQGELVSVTYVLSLNPTYSFNASSLNMIGVCMYCAMHGSYKYVSCYAAHMGSIIKHYTDCVCLILVFEIKFYHI
jgi:hypothetical protein